MDIAETKGWPAVLYGRVSTLAPGDRGRSVEEQDDGNAAACGRYGWPVAGRYADPGRSASRFARKDREDWPAFLNAIRAGTGKIAVLWEPSRGSRELEDWARFLTLCRGTRVMIYITDHDKLYDITSKRDWRSLAEDGVHSAYTSEETRDRVLRATTSSAVKGRPHGRTLYGYERIYDPATGQLAQQRPHQDTAPVVTAIITAIAAGQAATAIARDLTARQVPTPEGGRWTAGRIRSVALNPAYIARRSRHGDLTDAIWPAIVPEETFWRATAILTDPARQKHRPGAARYDLSYLATCGRCDGPLRHADVLGRHTYTCARGQCVAIRQDWLDGFVFGAVAARLDDPAFWDALASGGGDAAGRARARELELRQRLRDYQGAAGAGTITLASFTAIEAGLLPQIEQAGKDAAAASAPAALREFRAAPGQARAMLRAKTVAERKDLYRRMLADLALLPCAARGRAVKFDPARVRYEFRQPGL